MSKNMKWNVLLTPAKSLPADDARYASKVLGMKLGHVFSFELRDPIAFPLSEDYNETRRQYIAEAFLPLAKRLKEGNAYCLASILLTDVDIYAKLTNYVFGLADLVHRVAVVSSHRIHPSFWGLKETREFFETQWGKVVTHEFGHTLGLYHCDDPNCVMKYSNSPSELYKKGKGFCLKCAEEVGRMAAELSRL